MSTALAVKEKPEVAEVATCALPVEKPLSEVGPYRQWNPSAVACFLRESQCDGCFYQKFFDDKPYGCQMAHAVRYLLNQVGPPDEKRIRRLV